MIVKTQPATNHEAILQEAMFVLEQHHPRRTAVQRWVCEVCGMIHTGAAPQACDSCGNDVSLVQKADFHREMSSRW